MARLNKEEYEILKSYISEEKYIAKDRDGSIRLLTDYPERDMKREGWSDGWGKSTLKNSANNFQFIQWEDEEPYNIAELIEEYKDRGDIGYALEEYVEYIIKFSEKLLTESEEKMKKDIEWAKKEIKELITEESQNYPHDEMVEKEIVLGILNQLDEPEKVVIPKYVADWIEDLKSKKINLLEGMYDFTHGEDTHDYMREQSDTLMRAWLNGYTVEEEQLFYALIKGHELLKGKGDWVVPTYWCLDTTNGNMFISDRITVRNKFLIEASKSEWNKLGINDSNAHFVKVDEVEDER